MIIMIVYWFIVSLTEPFLQEVFPKKKSAFRLLLHKRDLNLSSSSQFEILIIIFYTIYITQHLYWDDRDTSNWNIFLTSSFLFILWTKIVFSQRKKSAEKSCLKSPTRNAPPLYKLILTWQMWHFQHGWFLCW